MTNSLKIIYFMLMVLVLAFSGCAGMDKNKQQNQIEISLNDFRKALRWGYFENASQFIQTKDYDKPLRDLDYLKNVRITSYEYGNKRFSEEGSRLDVIALISFYNVNQGTVSDIAVDQVWWFDAEKNRWFLDGDLPDLTY